MKEALEMARKLKLCNPQSYGKIRTARLAFLIRNPHSQANRKRVIYGYKTWIYAIENGDLCFKTFYGRGIK